MISGLLMMTTREGSCSDAHGEVASDRFWAAESLSESNVPRERQQAQGYSFPLASSLSDILKDCISASLAPGASEASPSTDAVPRQQGNTAS